MPYIIYILGVVLLAIPAGAFGRKRLKFALLTDLTDSTRLRLGWLHLFNVVDLVRGYAGITLVFSAFKLFEPTAPGQLLTRVVLAIAALLGLLLQHAFYRPDDEDMPTPVAYIIGLVLALLPFKVAMLSLPLGIASAIALRNLGGGLFFAAAATAVLGYLFRVGIPAIGTSCLLISLPVFLSMTFHRRLTLTVRRGNEVRQPIYRDVPSMPSR